MRMSGKFSILLFIIIALAVSNIAEAKNMTLKMRSQVLEKNDKGYKVWRVIEKPKVVKGEETAIIITDMWDRHWSRAMNERVAALAPKMNELIKKARAAGVIIIHCPSDCTDFYANDQARIMTVEMPQAPPPPEIKHGNPPQPIDASDGGSDTDDMGGMPWKRQIATIEINQNKDFITDKGTEVYSVLKNKGIKQVLIMGVATNMCVLERSFGIHQMVKWGVSIALVRDMTDTMYSPAMPPYVSHEQGTALVVGFIEKFWCPSISSADIDGTSK